MLETLNKLHIEEVGFVVQKILQVRFEIFVRVLQKVGFGVFPGCHICRIVRLAFDLTFLRGPNHNPGMHHLQWCIRATSSLKLRRPNRIVLYF